MFTKMEITIPLALLGLLLCSCGLDDPAPGVKSGTTCRLVGVPTGNAVVLAAASPEGLPYFKGDEFTVLLAVKQGKLLALKPGDRILVANASPFDDYIEGTMASGDAAGRFVYVLKKSVVAH
jgi:hypothetical protein